MYYADNIPLNLAVSISRLFPDRRIPVKAFTYGSAFSLFMERGHYPSVYYSKSDGQWLWSIDGVMFQCGRNWYDAADKAISAALEVCGSLKEQIKVF